MKTSIVCALALLAQALAGASAWGQTPVIFQSEEGGGQFLLAPAGHAGPLFLSGVASNPVGGFVPAPARLAATVNGNGLGDFGNLPAIFPSLRVDVGFEYLRPDFPNRSVTLVIPSGVNGNFAALAGSGNVSFDFGFIPHITMNYQFPDNPFGITASGELTSLSGHLARSIDSSAGTANLTATATVNIGIANVLEGTLRVPLGRFPRFQETCLENTILLGTIGLRYSHVSQDYNASLNSSGNSSTLAAHQDWDGFGLTTSLSFLYPLPRDLFLYGVSRGAFMVGQNNRVSTFSVTVSGNAAASTSTKLTDNRTEFIPVGEFEIGLGWGKPLGRPVGVPESAAAEAIPTGPILWVKAGLIADIWGSLGLLSSPNSGEGFSDSPLFLFGFSVMAGVEF